MLFDLCGGRDGGKGDCGGGVEKVYFIILGIDGLGMWCGASGGCGGMGNT